tara:strand:+ start:29317 stop:29673 length:357 start_codon:yes stop_codon:yes gene_type:complete
MSSNLQIPKKCDYCGNAFIARTTVTKYCSHICNSRHYKQIKRNEKVQQSLEQSISNPLPQANINPTQNKDFLSVSEVSQLIGVSRWTIQRMIKRGQLKAARFGRKQIITRSQIESLFH